MTLFLAITRCHKVTCQSSSLSFCLKRRQNDMTFIVDPDILIDKLPQPYRRIVSILHSEILQVVDDHIDRDVAAAKVEDREQGLMRMTINRKVVTCKDGITCATINLGAPLFGFSNGKLGSVQVLNEPITILRQPKTKPIYWLSPHAPVIFRSQLPPPLLVVAGSTTAIVVNAVTLTPVSEVLELPEPIIRVEASGLQGALLIAIQFASSLRIYAVEVPGPCLAADYLDSLDAVSRAEIDKWLPPAATAAWRMIRLVDNFNSFAMGAGIVWFRDKLSWAIQYVDPDFDFEPIQSKKQLLAKLKIADVDVVKVCNIAPLTITAMDAAGDDLVIGTCTGLVSHFRMSACVANLPSHYDQVHALSILKTNNLTPSTAITIGLDGFIHLYDLTMSCVTFRGVVSYPQMPPSHASILGSSRCLVFIGNGTAARVINFETGKRLACIQEFPQNAIFADSAILLPGDDYSIDTNLVETLAPSWVAQVPQLANDDIIPFGVNLDAKKFRHIRADVVKALRSVILNVKAEDDEARARKIRGH